MPWHTTKVNLKHCSKCFLTSLHLPLVMDSCMLHWDKCVIAKILLCIWLRNSSQCPVIQDWRISCQPSIILFTKAYWFLTAKGLQSQFYAASHLMLTEEQLMMSSDSRVTSLMPTVNNIVYQDVLVLNSWNFTQSNISTCFTPEHPASV